MKATKTLRHIALAAATGALALAGTMATAGTAAADAESVTMREPGMLLPGWHLDAGDTRLILQYDGNLVLYRAYQDPSLVHPVWSAPGAYGCGYKAIMQGDGNFVLYNSANGVCWSSNTFKSSSNQTAQLKVTGLGGLWVEFTNDNANWQPTIKTRSSDLY
ncbi:hypothetical protein [Kitasatospora sp. NPDC087314]|uniref:hypothetical protein n=1 Tax=Kitasatospora sp. NPDC087314 TaxID=3364068 RepID=UPI0037F8898E